MWLVQYKDHGVSKNDSHILRWIQCHNTPEQAILAGQHPVHVKFEGMWAKKRSPTNFFWAVTSLELMRKVMHSILHPIYVTCQEQYSYLDQSPNPLPYHLGDMLFQETERGNAWQLSLGHAQALQSLETKQLWLITWKHHACSLPVFRFKTLKQPFCQAHVFRCQTCIHTIHTQNHSHNSTQLR